MKRYVACLVLAALTVAGCDRGAAGDSGANLDTEGGVQSGPPGQPEDRALPDVALPDLQGELRGLRDAPNEVTLINFWATWCLPCLKELPELVALHDSLGGRGLHVVGIAVDSGDPADIGEFARQHGMTYTLLTTRSSWAREHFDVFGLPVTLVVDGDGRVRRRLIGPQSGAQFRAALRPYL